MDIFGHSVRFRLYLSASVEHVRNQRGSLFCLSPCLCRSGTEFILDQDRMYHIWCFVICAQIEKCSQVSSWCLQNRFKRCLFFYPSGKVLCVFSHPFIRHPLVFLSWLFRAVPAWYFMPRTQVCLLDLKLENPRTLNSAHPCLSLSRTLRSTNLVFCFFHAPCEVRDSYSAYSGKQCEIVSDKSG